MIRTRQPRFMPGKAAAATVIAAACCLGVGAACAQTSHSDGASSMSSGGGVAAAAPPASSPEASGDDPLAAFRAPLLREGSVLVDVHATLASDEAGGGWRLVLQDVDPNHQAQDLVLLPCTTLSEMRRFVEASPNQHVIFQVTGSVYLYRGRNYVLPTHAPVLSQEEVHAPEPAAKAAATQPAGNPPTGEGESAEDIVRKLERATGPLVRNTPPPAAAASGSGSRPAEHGAVSSSGSVLRENTAITARRGKLKRDVSGGWLFVFDADASGLADPPLKLLPCLLLERIEDYARKTGNNSPALLSGQIYLFEGHNYVLPTVFRIPQDRRNLTP